MTTAVLRSFNPDHDLIIVKVDGRSPQVALKVCRSDRSTMARLPAGSRIHFDFACDRHGQVFAIDITPLPPLPSVLGRRASAQDDTDLSGPKCFPFSELEADLEALLAAPIIRRLMQKDGVDPQSVRALIRTVARAAAKPHQKN
jgi:hypothetical protein